MEKRQLPVYTIHNSDNAVPNMTRVQCFHFSLDANWRRMINELTRKATKMWKNVSRHMCIKYEGTGSFFPFFS
jgi:ribosomal protein S6